MKVCTAALIALACVISLVAADYSLGYGGYGASYGKGYGGGYGGGVAYVPAYGGGSAGGLGQGGLLGLVGLLFLLMFLFRPAQSTGGVSFVNVTAA